MVDQAVPQPVVLGLGPVDEASMNLRENQCSLSCVYDPSA
jgi:hypothetical protein